MRVHLFLNKKSKVQTILNDSESLRVLEISGFQNSLEVTFLQKTKILLITKSFFFFEGGGEKTCGDYTLFTHYFKANSTVCNYVDIYEW